MGYRRVATRARRLAEEDSACDLPSLGLSPGLALAIATRLASGSRRLRLRLAGHWPRGFQRSLARQRSFQAAEGPVKPGSVPLARRSGAEW
jgi:hypothetical protein